MVSFDDITDLRTFCAKDFKHYVEYKARAAGYVPQQFQYVVADFLQGAKKKWVRRKKTLLGFRGSAKTWEAVRAYAEWRLLRVPSTQIIIQSSTDRLAAGINQSMLETLKYDELFTHLRPKGSSGTMQFSLPGFKPEKGETVTCAGVNTAMTGSRANLYIFDDPEPDNNPEALYERILAAFQEAELILHPAEFLWPNGDVPDPEQTQILVVGQPHWTGTAYLPHPPDPDSGELQSHPLQDAIRKSVV